LEYEKALRSSGMTGISLLSHFQGRSTTDITQEELIERIAKEVIKYMIESMDINQPLPQDTLGSAIFPHVPQGTLAANPAGERPLVGQETVPNTRGHVRDRKGKGREVAMLEVQSQAQPILRDTYTHSPTRGDTVEFMELQQLVHGLSIGAGPSSQRSWPQGSVEESGGDSQGGQADNPSERDPQGATTNPDLPPSTLFISAEPKEIPEVSSSPQSMATHPAVNAELHRRAMESVRATLPQIAAEDPIFEKIASYSAAYFTYWAALQGIDPSTLALNSIQEARPNNRPKAESIISKSTSKRSSRRTILKVLRRLGSGTLTDPDCCIPSTAKVRNLRSSATALKMPRTLEMKVISPNGAMVGLLCPDLRQFWVFKVDGDPIELVCTGEFPNAQGFQRGRGDAPLKTQSPPPRHSHLQHDFHSSAISDDFLALGCRGIIMTFFLHGEEAGCWITTSKLEEDTIPEHLTFSPNGDQLAALVSTNYRYSILLFSTSRFPREKLARQDGFEPVEPKIDVTISLPSFSPCEPSRITFSQDGTMLAISTTLNDNIAKLQLYKRSSGKWEGGEMCYVSLFPHDDPTTWHGSGITDITLYYLEACTIY
jgi:hypothetical protein